jgi:hypothetical protein
VSDLFWLQKQYGPVPDCRNVQTPEELAERCLQIWEWWERLQECEKLELLDPPTYISVGFDGPYGREEPFWRARIRELTKVAVRLGMTSEELPDTTPLGETKAQAVLNQLEKWALGQSKDGSDDESAPAADHCWSEAKSPTEWRKELGISETTWRRHTKDGTLVIDRITTKRVRIRLDCLARYRPSK